MVNNCYYRILSCKNFVYFLLPSIDATFVGAAKLSITFFTLREVISIMSTVALTAYSIVRVCMYFLRSPHTSIVFTLR